MAVGKDSLAGGGTASTPVEKVVRFLEDDPMFNAGKGAVYAHEGTHELDAAIMDGKRPRLRRGRRRHHGQEPDLASPAW